jgi:2-polyprenyl-3-methyl-5-hydroxy-6-metoxy-1,4-benzoquinol methylase
MSNSGETAISDDARRRLVRQTRDIWEQTAANWDKQPGSSDGLHHRLLQPTVDGLLAPAPGERILEIACGNGALARHLAGFGADVVATDYAETFIARARKEPQPGESRIDFRVVDATSERELQALGRHAFEAAVCHMALTDMAVIEPLFWALPRLLKPGGRFVFTIMHPCFNHAGSRFVATESSGEAASDTHTSLSIARYLQVPNSPSRRPGTSEVRPISFHRPLSEILNAAFNAGMVMDAVAEPSYRDARPANDPLSWANLPDVPPVFAARFRPAGIVAR